MTFESEEAAAAWVMSLPDDYLDDVWGDLDLPEQCEECETTGCNCSLHRDWPEQEMKEDEK